MASSFREGLPVNILEAMYMKIPIVAMDNRGHRELIENNINGYIVENNSQQMKNRIEDIIKNKEKTETFVKKNKEEVEKYLLKNVKKEMEKIYEKK